MMNKFKCPMPNRNKAIAGSSKGNQEPKAKFKLFEVPQQSVSKCKNKKKGASSDISVVLETESSSSGTMSSRKNSRNALSSPLKTLGDMLGGMGVDFTFDFEEVNMPEPGCSKVSDTEPQRRFSKRNVAKKCYKEEDLPSEDEFLCE